MYITNKHCINHHYITPAEEERVSGTSATQESGATELPIFGSPIYAEAEHSRKT